MDTNGIETWNTSEHRGLTQETALTIFSLVEILLGSFANGFVIFVLFWNSRLLEIPANAVLLSLAISDFLACSAVLPFHLYELLHLRETLLHHTLLLFSMTVGMFGTVLLTADRFLAIIWPLRYSILVTTSRTRVVVIMKWFVSFAHSTIFYIASTRHMKGLRYFLSIVKIGAVFTIIVLYAVIFRAALRQIRRIQDRNESLRSVGFVVFKRTLKSAKTSGSVVFFFAVTYLPVFINSAIAESRSISLSIYNERTAWFLALAYFNCCVNPILYCTFSEKLRAVIRKTLRRACCVSKNSVHLGRNSRLQSRSLFVSRPQTIENPSVPEMSTALSVLSVDENV